MSVHKSPQEETNEPESLITERDIDEKFGLFQEDSFPDALADQNQKEAINHALPKDEAASNLEQGFENKELNSMTEGYNKTTADITYEQYNQLGSVTSDEDQQVEDFRKPTLITPVGLDGAVDEETDAELVNDKHIIEDVGLHHVNVLERDEVLNSDAVYIATTAGLTGNPIDYADEDADRVNVDEEEDLPLEDVPDAD